MINHKRLDDSCTHHTNQRTAGFSLIELVIVIAIVAILTTIATLAYTVTQRQARDAKRNADIAVLQSELEKFYDKHGEYPPGCAHNSCTSWFHTTNVSTPIHFNATTTVANVKTVLPGIPADFGDPRYSGQPPFAAQSTTPRKYFYYGGTVNYNTFSSSLSYSTPAPVCTIYSGLAPGQAGSYVVGYFSEEQNKWVLNAGRNGDQMSITSGNASDGCVINKS